MFRRSLLRARSLRSPTSRPLSISTSSQPAPAKEASTSTSTTNSTTVQNPPSPNNNTNTNITATKHSSPVIKKKTIQEADEEVRQKLEAISGEGGEAGLELEGGKPVAMKRGVRENMFRLI